MASEHMDVLNGARLRSARMFLRMSVRDAASACGVSCAEYGQWERGVTPFDAKTVERIMLDEARGLRDLELLAQLRAHKELPDVLSTALDFAVNCRDVVDHVETEDPQVWRDRADAYDILVKLLRNEWSGT